MKNKDVTRYSVIGLTILSIALVSLIAFQKAKSAPQQKNLTPEQEQKLRADLSNRGGLKRAAQAAGGWTSSESATWEGDYDLEGLAAQSKYVIVGKPLSNRCQYREKDNGDTITTDYQVEVTEPIKGDLKDKEVIKVSLKGGRVQFEDGSWATIRTPDFKKMENGKTYVLFLIPNSASDPELILTGGSQGLFELTEDDKVIPHGHKAFRVQNYKDLNIHDFKALVKHHVDRHPEVRECCSQK